MEELRHIITSHPVNIECAILMPCVLTFLCYFVNCLCAKTVILTHLSS
jgi:hypothetical protein